MSVRILIGDVRDMLRTLDADSVDCVVTSPPYWGLRDYGVAGQLGLERTLGEHVEVMTEVFRDVRRVLKPTGTLWLNYGDSYATSVNGRSAADTKSAGNDNRTFRDKPFSTIGPVWRAGNPDKNGGQSNRNGLSVDADAMLKPKDLCGIPWRVAFALQADGWWLRQDIIWSKPNPMPESVTDRCTKAHEYLFLLAKSERYYFDQDAIAEALADSSVERPNLENQLGSNRVPGKTNGPMKAVGRSAHMVGTSRNDGDRWRTADGGVAPRGSRNKRSVWEVATAPFSEAHFATFPPDLIEPCIKAGTSERGNCRQCGAPWVRITVKGDPDKETTRGRQPWAAETGQRDSAGGLPKRETTTLRWEPSCKCSLPNTFDAVPYSPKAATVLDPFLGAGTTALVADRLGRNCIGIELNPAYAAIAERRIKGDCPMFVEVA